MSSLTKSTILGAALLLAYPVAWAQDDTLGQREYESNCAVCHGADGKGNGPLAGYLSEQASDLTALRSNNNGVFPSSYLRAVIDGREMVAVHGTRDMPAWGHEYSDRAVEYYSDFFGEYSSEAFVNSRVLALVDYIYRLQEEE